MGYLGKRENASFAGVSYLEVPKPTECTENSWLIAIVNNNGIEGTHTMRVLDNLGVVDDNWVLHGHLGSSLVGSSNAHLWIWKRRIGAGEDGSNGPTGFRFDNLGGNRTMAIAILAYDNMNLSDPIADSVFNNSSGGSSISITCPNLSTTEDNQYVIRCGATRSIADFQTLTGYTPRVDFDTLEDPDNSGSTAAFSIFWQEILKANPGLTSQDIVTSLGVASEHVGATLILANAPAVPPETTTLVPDGVAASSGYANATTGNIANVQGDPDSQGGTGFTAS